MGKLNEMKKGWGSDA